MEELEELKILIFRRYDSRTSYSTVTVNFTFYVNAKGYIGFLPVMNTCSSTHVRS